MSNDPFKDPETQAFFRRAKEYMFPRMKASAMSLTVLTADPDPKLCIELGAAILFDKPIVIVAPPDVPIPANLKRLAAHIIQGDMSDPATGQKLRDALTAVMENDQRTKKAGATS